MKCGTTIGSSLLVDEGSRSVTPLFNRKLGDSTTTITMLSLLVANFVCGKCIRSGNWLVANREWLIDELVPPTIHPQLRRSLIQTRRCLCCPWLLSLMADEETWMNRLQTVVPGSWHYPVVHGSLGRKYLKHMYIVPRYPSTLRSRFGNTRKHLMSGWLDTSSVCRLLWVCD